MHQHAQSLVRHSFLGALGCAALFTFTLTRTPWLLGYWLGCILTGVLYFLLLWRHLYRPRLWSFAVLLALALLAGRILQSIFLPAESTATSVWFTAQFVLLFSFAVFSLLRLFRRRLLASVQDPGGAA